MPDKTKTTSNETDPNYRPEGDEAEQATDKNNQAQQRNNQAQQQKADPDQENRRRQDDMDKDKDPPKQVNSPSEDKPAR